MKNTYAHLQQQIAALEVEAARLKKAELEVVISKMKEGISTYGLTPQDLFGPKVGNGSMPTRTLAPGTKFRDSAGNTWGGRGPRPAWLRDALAGGAKLEEFATAKRGAPLSSVSGGSIKKTKSKKSRIKFKDGAGNSWSGRGRKPGWLAIAISTGKKLEDFAV